MNVAQLKEKLNDYPDNMEIAIRSTESEFSFAPINQLTEVDVDFKEDPHGKVLNTQKCLLLDEL